MTTHPHSPGLASRRCSAAASSPAPFRETLRGNGLLGANPFSRFSNRFLSLLLESGGILALVAFLPNESYAGRADEVLMGPSSRSALPIRRGFCAPAPSLSTYPTLSTYSPSRKSCPSSKRRAPKCGLARTLVCPREASRIRGSFEERR